MSEPLTREQVENQRDDARVVIIRLDAENAALRQQLAAMTEERDEQCAGKMAFFGGMNDMREQRTKLERQLAKVTNDTQYHMDCITLLAKHIGRLGETSNTVVDAAIQQLAAVTQQLAEMTQAWRDGQAEISRLSVFHEDDEPSWRHRAEALTQQLAEMTLRRAETLAMCDQLMKERDEAEAERIEWVQRGERAEQQLATLTQERDEAVRIAKELMEPSPVTKADVKQAQDMAIFLNRQLAKLTQERDEAKKE